MHLQQFLKPSEPDLLSLPTVAVFIAAVKNAMTNQLSRFWDAFPGGRYTRCIHPNWKLHKLESFHVTRAAEVTYYQLGFRQNDLNVYKHSIGLAPSTKCRTCGRCEETVYVLFDCVYYQK